MPFQNDPHSRIAPPTLGNAGLPRRVRRTLEKVLGLLSDELDRGLSLTLAEFEQELFRLADRAANPGLESGYLQALRVTRHNRADVLPRILVLLEGNLAGLRHRAVATAKGASLDLHELKLLEHRALEEDAVLREMATRQEARASLSLQLLAQRFGVLAGSPPLELERLPVGPQALCGAMREASESLQLEHAERMLLFRMFDRHAMARYARFADELDKMLAGEGVLPGLTFVPLRTRPAPQLRKGAEAAPSAGGAATAPGQPGGGPATGHVGGGSGGGGHGGSPAGGGARGNAAGGGAGGGTGGNATGGGTGNATGAGPANGGADGGVASPSGGGGAGGTPGAAASGGAFTAWLGEPAPLGDPAAEDAAFGSLQQLLAGRRQLIGKLRPTRQPTASRDVLATPEVLGALKAAQATLAANPGAPVDLADLRHMILGQARKRVGPTAQLSQDDSDTFELLGLLYSHLDAEIRPDAPAAALVKRLQVPLLRAALGDRGFFVRARHPARQLLGTVAEAAARWMGDGELDPQLLAPLQEAVNHVVQHYDGDLAVFDASNRQLEGHLESYVHRVELLERRNIEAARGKERLEIAKQRAADTLKELIGGKRLPKFSLALLNQAWLDVLTLTQLRQGEDSDEWRHQLDVTRQIIAACGPGAQPASDGTLPAHVESALKQIGYHDAEAGAIAQRLTGIHGEDEDDAASRTELAIKLKGRVRLGEDAAKAAKSKLPPRNAQEEEHYRHARTLPFGTWIEFVQNQQGDLIRRRLSWYSPMTDHALFVNARGQRVAEMTLDALARMFAAGQARVVDAQRGRLVDRAWQAALNALRGLTGGHPAPAEEMAT